MRNTTGEPTCRRILMMVLVASVGLRLPAGAQGIKLGVMGDSLSDEYSDWSDRAYAQNWVEQLVNYRGFDCGPTAVAAGQPGGTWGDVRGAGYAYDWADPMATSSSLLQQGQHTKLAAQIVANQIPYAVLAIGSNDFNPHSEVYAGIYHGTWSAAKVRDYEAGVLANIETAIATNLLAGARLVLIDLADCGATPFVLSNPLYPDAAKRERVSAVLQNVNHQLADLAQQYQIPLVDWFGLEEAMTGPLTNMHATLLIGNVPIQLPATDPGPGPNSRPTAAFVADGYHPHTTIQAILANAVLQALNDAYAANVPLFTEEEILGHAGLPYGGADTLPAQIGQYSRYVIRPNRISPTGSFTFTFPTNCTSLTAITDATGDYQSVMATAHHRSYRLDVAQDESGKLSVVGTIDGIRPEGGGELSGIVGAVRTVNGQPTAELKGSFDGTLDGVDVTARGAARGVVRIADIGGTNGVSGTGGGRAKVAGVPYALKNAPIAVPVTPAEAGNVRGSWGLTLNIRSRTDPKTGKPGVAASAQLRLPSGDTIVYPEIAAKYSAKTGYSLPFKGGTNVTVQPNLPDKKSTVSIKGMTLAMQDSSTDYQPTAGTISYQFLGQKGSGNLLDFLGP